MGDLRQAQGNLQEAEELYGKAFDIFKQNDLKHPRVEKNFNALFNLLKAQGRDEEANLLINYTTRLNYQ